MSPLCLRAYMFALLSFSSCCALAQTAPAHAQLAPARNGAFTMTTSDGVTLQADIAGKGLPCVFIHGGPGSGSESVQRLAGKTMESNFQMIWLDQRGSGRSASAANGNYALERVVDDLDELRARLNLEQWVVMSHSFGGIIATAYARKYPQRVRGLILANSMLSLGASMESTSARGYALLPAQGRPPMDPAAPLPQRFGMVMAMLNQQKLMDKMMYADGATAARVADATRGLASNRAMGTALFQGGAITSYLEDFGPASNAIKAPVLVLAGVEDDMVGREHYQSFRFPDQRVVLMPGKHFAMIESPREFSAALAEFAARLERR
jgi:proline iminopeptidase